MSDFAILWTVAHQASLYFTISLSLLKLMSIESVTPSNHLILYCTLLLLPSVYPSIWVFSNELALCIRWPKYWSFNFSISPSSEYSGLISFQIDWFDLFAVRGTIKSLIQNYSFKSINSSALSLLHDSTLTSELTTGKTIGLTIWTFVDQVMSLLFNTLSKVCHSVSSKEQASFNFVAVVLSDFGAQENKICHCFHFFPIYLPRRDGTGCCGLHFLNALF